MDDRQLAVLAVFAMIHGENVEQIIEFARSIDVIIDAQDCVTLFHYINDIRSNHHEHASTL
jgi:hypothetical protein